MTSIFDKLNLRPGERRMVVVVALIVFIVLNAMFVWPEFMKWGKTQQRHKSAEDSLRQFQREVDKTSDYEKQLKNLEKAGASIGSEDQALKLSTTVYSQAALSGVQVNQYTPVAKTTGGGKTNQFFDEQSGNISFVAEENALVDFLYNLGVGGSMIRVRTMTLNPDPPRQRLQGSMTLVASYARKAATKVVPGVTPATTAAPSARPAAAPGTPKPTISSALKSAVTNAPAPQKSWLSRLWPFGKGSSSAPVPTNAPAKTNAPPQK